MSEWLLEKERIEGINSCVNGSYRSNQFTESTLVHACIRESVADNLLGIISVTHIER